MSEENEQFYRDSLDIAFPKLDDRQLGLLEPLGERRTLWRGAFVFKACQRGGRAPVAGNFRVSGRESSP